MSPTAFENKIGFFKVTHQCKLSQCETPKRLLADVHFDKNKGL